jgi:hypothetical protein
MGKACAVAQVASIIIMTANINVYDYFLLLSLKAMETVSPVDVNKTVTEHLSCTMNNSA